MPTARDWILLNASPEIRQQIESFPPLHPRGPRHSPIAAIVLTNGDLAHCLGLLSLRESHPLVVYATTRVRQGFTTHNIFYKTLERFPGQITWRELKLGREDDLADPAGNSTGLTIEPLGAPGKPPVHLEAVMPPDEEDNVILRLRQPAAGRTLAVAANLLRNGAAPGR